MQAEAETKLQALQATEILKNIQVRKKEQTRMLLLPRRLGTRPSMTRRDSQAHLCGAARLRNGNTGSSHRWHRCLQISELQEQVAAAEVRSRNAEEGRQTIQVPPLGHQDASLAAQHNPQAYSRWIDSTALLTKW